jgi:hypothetical protein
MASSTKSDITRMHATSAKPRDRGRFKRLIFSGGCTRKTYTKIDEMAKFFARSCPPWT